MKIENYTTIGLYKININKYINNAIYHTDNNVYPDINLNFHSKAIYNQAFCGKKVNYPTRLERFIGCLLGGAIGDSLGAPIEFLKLSEIYNKYGDKGITLKHFIKSRLPLEFTDDTQMTFFTADGLIKSAIKNKSKYKIDFMDVYESYRDWLNTQLGVQMTDKGWICKIKELYQVKAPGNTCISSLMGNIPGTVKYKINNSKGNGGVMRVAPIGLLYHSKPNIAFKTGIACTALTHSNPDAYLSAGALSSIISYILQGKTLEEAVNISIRLLKKFDNSDELIRKLKQALVLAQSNVSSTSAIEIIGEGKIASEALSISIYSSLKNKMNFSKSVEMSANINGDSDTVAAITGNIVGAYNGIQKIPKNALALLTNAKELKELSKDLFVQHNNITCKSNRYPIFPTFREVYNIDRMLKNTTEKEDYAKQYKIFIDTVYKKLKTKAIKDYNSYFTLNDVPTNIVEKIITPMELINNELKYSNDYNKFISIFVENFEALIKNENMRGCFLDEKYAVEDILWMIYEKAIAKNKNTNEILRRVSYMISSKEYNIKSIIDYLNNI